MENQPSPFLTWPYFFQGKTMEELSQSLLVTTLELETTKVRAQGEMKIRDDQLLELTDMLEQTIRDRDEAQAKCQQLLFDKLILQQQQQQIQLQQFHYKNQTAPHSAISSIEDDPRNGNISSSDCEESIVSSPIQEKGQDFFLALVTDKPLPEKGKLLQAVIKAGPLLHTLLLAGPLPKWQHPPPPLDNYQIPPPPVTVPTPSQPPPQEQHHHRLLYQDSFMEPPVTVPTPSLPPPQEQQHHLHYQDSFMDVTTFNNINRFGEINRKRRFSEVIDSSTETR